MRKYIELYGNTDKEIAAEFNNQLQNYTITHQRAVIGIYDGKELILNGNISLPLKSLHLLWNICSSCNYELAEAGKTNELRNHFQ